MTKILVKIEPTRTSPETETLTPWTSTPCPPSTRNYSRKANVLISRNQDTALETAINPGRSDSPRIITTIPHHSSNRQRSSCAHPVFACQLTRRTSSRSHRHGRRRGFLKRRSASMSASPMLSIYSVTLAEISNKTMHIPIRILHDGKTVETKALIDLGAGGTFMDQNFAQKH